MPIRKSILIFVIVASCLCSYFNTLFADFVWDDSFYLIKNSYVKSFKFLPLFFTNDFGHVHINKIDSHYYRPLLAFSYMFNHSLWGKNPLGYHIVSLILHIAICILIFLFIKLLTGEKFLAFVSSLLFAVHPIHTEAVSFISYGLSNISVVFFMASLILFIKHVRANNFLFYLFSLVCFLFSLLTMETTISLPLIIICIDYIFISKCNIRTLVKNLRSFHLGFFVVLGVYLLTRSYFIGWSFIAGETQLGTNFISGTSPFWRIYTAIKIIVLYTKVLILPYNLMTDHIIFPANSLFEPVVIIGIATLSLFLYTSFKCIKKYPIFSLSIFWFLIAILPLSNIFPLKNIFSERSLYIPSIGFCMGIGFMFFWLLQKDIKTRLLNYKKSIVFVFILLVLALGRVTYERNKVWENDFTLWYDTVMKSPNSPRAHYNLGRVYFNLNFLEEAIEQYDLALMNGFQSAPSVKYGVLNAKGQIYLRKGLTGEAIESFKSAITILPHKELAYNNLANAYSENRQYKEAEEAALTALDKNPYLNDAYYTLAIIYRKSGMLDAAINSFKEYLKFRPDFPEVYLDIGYVYYEKGDFQEAGRFWLKALKIEDDFQPTKDALRLLNGQKI